MNFLQRLLFFSLLTCGLLCSVSATPTTAEKKARFLHAKQHTATVFSKKHTSHGSSHSTTTKAHSSSTPRRSSASLHRSSSSHRSHPTSHTSTAQHHISSSVRPSNSHITNTSSSSQKKTSPHHATTSSQQETSHTASTGTSSSKASLKKIPDQLIPIDPSAAKQARPAITIEKSGILADQGLEPIPTPPPRKQGPFGWLFGHRGPRYRYLSYSVRRAIDRAPVHHGRWKYIVVHNSGTRAGNAHSFDIYHRRVRRMQNGLAYHFVIGNGVSSGNGEIEVGHRWIKQLQGGHVASDYLNDISLGICLVGDYNRDRPTSTQLGALTELITYLRQRVGKTQGRQSMVAAHKEINPRPTDCPGSHFPYHWLHSKFGR